LTDRFLLSCILPQLSRCLLFVLLLLSSPIAAATLTGRVVGVTDGDTIKLLVDGRSEYKVRLGEIDAPESGQPFGQKSKRMLSDLVFNRTVSVRVTDVDRYGRSVGVIRAGRVNINAEMVKRGGAWAYRRYLSDQRYLLWEREAQQARRGLWNLQADQIMAPWEWRAARRGGRSGNQSAAGMTPIRGPAYAASIPSESACGSKSRCSQMTSCAEATYYLRSCRATRLDGDGDGVPCEKICG
jgi:endonuclease YncB( thermonuclease family)